MQTKLDYPRKNQDPRQKAAYYMMQENGPGAYELLGTTRSGKSVALVSESLNRKESLVVIIPTNSIKDRTFNPKIIERYSDVFDFLIKTLPANKECKFNQKLIQDYPGVNHLPYLPLTEKCFAYDKEGNLVKDECCEHVDYCKVVSVLTNKCDVVVLTYPKLVALCLSAMSADMNNKRNVASEIIDLLITYKNHLMDEYHVLQRGRKCTLTVKRETKKMPLTMRDLSKFLPAMQYKYIGMYLRAFASILADNDIIRAMDDVYEEASKPDSWRRHLRRSVSNKHQLGIDEDGNEKPLDYPENLMGAYSDIISIAKEIDTYEYEREDLCALISMMTIAAADDIIVHAEKNRGVKINLVTEDVLYREMIRWYTRQLNLNESRLIFASATAGSTDVSDFLPHNVKAKKLLHGHKGDPMHTNEIMYILADHKKFGAIGRYSIQENLNEIAQDILKILDAEGEDNCYIVTRSARIAKLIHDKLNTLGKDVMVDYYRSDKTIGVEMACRVCIAIGCAETPANSYDAITSSAMESRAMRLEAVCADTFQAWSRVKDPWGVMGAWMAGEKKISIVYALGCSQSQCLYISIWGSQYYVSFQNEDMTEWSVKCNNDVSRPNVIACKDVESMIIQGCELRKNSSHASKMLKMPLLLKKGKNLQFTSDSKEIAMYNQDAENLLGQNVIVKNYILVGKYEFLLRIAHNREKFLEGDYQGGWFTNHAQLSDSLIKSHAEGKGVIGVYPIAEDGTVSWICFDVDGHPKVEKQIADLNKWYSKEIDKIQRWYAAAIGVVGITPEISVEDMEWRSRIFAEFNEKLQALKDQKNMDEDACFAAAEAQLEKLTSFLDAQHIPYKLEASGGAHCYHVWIFLKPVHAKIARAFGELIDKKSGAQVAEINPKQVNKGGQNGVKLPFANYGYLKPSMGARRLKKSQLMDKGVFVDDIGEIEIQELDISNFIFEKPIVTETQKKQKTETTIRQKESFEPSGVRPFFPWARTQQLEGYQGDRCRVALFREYFANGLTDPEALARLFEHQNDYDFDESLRQVKSLMKKEFGPWKHETMERDFGDILDCYNRGVDFHYEEYVYDHAPGQDKELV